MKKISILILAIAFSYVPLSAVLECSDVRITHFIEDYNKQLKQIAETKDYFASTISHVNHAISWNSSCNKKKNRDQIFQKNHDYLVETRETVAQIKTIMLSCVTNKLCTVKAQIKLLHSLQNEVGEDRDVDYADFSKKAEELHTEYQSIELTCNKVINKINSYLNSETTKNEKTRSLAD